MRSLLKLLVCLLLSFLPPCAISQSSDQLYTATREQLDVTKVLLAQQSAWNKGDLNAYLALYKDAPDTVAMLSGPVRGLEAIRTAYRASFPNAPSMGTLEESDVEVRAMGENFALATGKYRLLRSRKLGGEVSGNFSLVMEKTDAGWRVIFSENT